MNKKEQLIAALLKKGQQQLAEHLGISAAEMSRKMNSEQGHGFTLGQLAECLEFVGAQIIAADDDMVSVSKDELQSLNLLARRYLDRRCK